MVLQSEPSPLSMALFTGNDAEPALGALKQIVNQSAGIRFRVVLSTGIPLKVLLDVKGSVKDAEYLDNVLLAQ